MKARCSCQKNQALTLIEVLAAIFSVIVISAFFILPWLARAKIHGGPNCVSHLRQISLACQIWANDNNNKFPMEISVTNGGAMELAAAGNVTAIFQMMSNELSTPELLICPEDKQHACATNFSSGFSNANISYFIGLNAGENNPQTILSGDDNFLFNGAPIKSGLCEITSNTPFAWSDTRHVFVRKTGWFSKIKTGYGYIVLADGSAQEISQSGLRQAFQQSDITNRLAVP